MSSLIGCKQYFSSFLGGRFGGFQVRLDCWGVVWLETALSFNGMLLTPMTCGLLKRKAQNPGIHTFHEILTGSGSRILLMAYYDSHIN